MEGRDPYSKTDQFLPLQELKKLTKRQGLVRGMQDSSCMCQL